MFVDRSGFGLSGELGSDVAAVESMNGRGGAGVGRRSVATDFQLAILILCRSLTIWTLNSARASHEFNKELRQI